MYNPYNNYYQSMIQQSQYGQTQQPSQQLIRVSGIDGARAYQMQPNSIVALFDNNDDLMYIKTSDGAGFPTVRTFRFEEVKDTLKTQVSATNEYITRKEMEEYVEQFIQSATATNQQSPNGNDKADS